MHIKKIVCYVAKYHKKGNVEWVDSLRDVCYLEEMKKACLFILTFSIILAQGACFNFGRVRPLDQNYEYPETIFLEDKDLEQWVNWKLLEKKLQKNPQKLKYLYIPPDTKSLNGIEQLTGIEEVDIGVDIKYKGKVDDFKKFIAPLMKLKKIKELGISGYFPTIKFIRHFNYLTNLNIGCNEKNNNLNYPKLPRLNKLKMNGCALRNQFNAFPNLNELNLTWEKGIDLTLLSQLGSLKKITLKEFPRLDLLPNIPTLKTLKLDGLTSIKGLNRFSKVERLSLEGKIKKLNALKTFNNLLELEIYPDEKINISTDLIASFKKLQKLTLHDFGLSDITFLNQLPKLKEIDLRNNQITQIPNLTLPHLEVLDIAFNPIRKIPYELSFPKLKELSIGEDIQKISILDFRAHSPHLRKLDLYGEWDNLDSIFFEPKALTKTHTLRRGPYTYKAIWFRIVNQLKNVKSENDLYKTFYNYPNHSPELDINVEEKLQNMGFEIINPTGEIDYLRNIYGAFVLFDPRMLPAYINSHPKTITKESIAHQIEYVKDLKDTDGDRIGGTYLGNKIYLDLKKRLSMGPRLYTTGCFFSAGFGLVNTIIHEYAHALDDALELIGFFSHGFEWSKAIETSDPVSFYGLKNPRENFAEAVNEYLFNPTFKCYAPKMYKILSAKILVNKEIYGSTKPFTEMDCSSHEAKDILFWRRRAFVRHFIKLSSNQGDLYDIPFMINGYNYGAYRASKYEDESIKE